MKERSHLNVTFVIIVILKDDISMDILNQFMKERQCSFFSIRRSKIDILNQCMKEKSHPTVTFLMEVILTNDILTDK